MNGAQYFSLQHNTLLTFGTFGRIRFSSVDTFLFHIIDCSVGILCIYKNIVRLGKEVANKTKHIKKSDRCCRVVLASSLAGWCTCRVHL